METSKLTTLQTDDGDIQIGCREGEHTHAGRTNAPIDENAMERASRIFRALGDTSRLRLATRLAAGPVCVTELAGLEHESITTISQRLRVLRNDNIVRRRRDGKHMLYFLSDQHMLDLVSNGLAHVSESPTPSSEPAATEL